MTTPTLKLSVAAAAFLAAGSAFSHVSLQDPAAAAGASYRAVLQVSHGCAGSPTNSITVVMPAGFNAAQPLVKAGWTLTTQVGKLAEPYEMHGTSYTEGVQAITWTAKSSENALPDALADEFAWRGTTPQTPGRIWFKVVQGCEKGRIDWTEIPAPGQTAHGLKSPAASLDVLDVQAIGGHAH